MLSAVFSPIGKVWYWLLRGRHQTLRSFHEDLLPNLVGPPALSEKHHLVLFVGDSLATGLGDNAFIGFRFGLPAQMEAMLNKTGNTRMAWTCLGAGSDHLTSAGLLEEWDRFVNEKPYYAQAKIIVLCIGRMDCHPVTENQHDVLGTRMPTIDETMANIEAACARVWARGASVVLNTVVEIGEVASNFTPSELNSRIMAFVKRVEAVNDPARRIRLGIDFHHDQRVAEASNLFDAALSPTCLETASHMLFPALESAALAVEFAAWTQILSTGKK